MSHSSVDHGVSTVDPMINRETTDVQFLSVTTLRFYTNSQAEGFHGRLRAISRLTAPAQGRLAVSPQLTMEHTTVNNETQFLKPNGGSG